MSNMDVIDAETGEIDQAALREFCETYEPYAQEYLGKSMMECGPDDLEEIGRRLQAYAEHELAVVERGDALAAEIAECGCKIGAPFAADGGPDIEAAWVEHTCAKGTTSITTCDEIDAWLAQPEDAETVVRTPEEQASFDQTTESLANMIRGVDQQARVKAALDRAADPDRDLSFDMGDPVFQAVYDYTVRDYVSGPLAEDEPDAPVDMFFFSLALVMGLDSERYEKSPLGSEIPIQAGIMFGKLEDEDTWEGMSSITIEVRDNFDKSIAKQTRRVITEGMQARGVISTNDLMFMLKVESARAASNA